MKRILVIDDSDVVRETLALILRRDFVVLQRSIGTGAVPLPDSSENIDLLVFGVTPTLGVEISRLLAFAAQAPFAVLFLVDSKSAARALQDQDQVGCLVKPFNPFALLDEINQLLTRRAIVGKVLPGPPATENFETDAYLEYPLLSRAAASLVHRFAATRLPLLIFGEIGCGQERVARGICDLRAGQGRRISINAAEISKEYLTQKKIELASNLDSEGSLPALIIENLDKGSPSGQTILLRYLEEVQENFGPLQLLTTSRTDLLEKVYEGALLETLYYKLATLTLKLLPLRDRRADIPQIAAWFAQTLGRTLGLGTVTFSPEANERLSTYLWFGNVNEMETVVARTLAAHRKSRIEASDIFFDFSPESELPEFPDAGKSVAVAPQKKEDSKSVPIQSAGHNDSALDPGMGNGRSQAMELNVVIHELAHELKNPMVTIKTFAQLLRDRYQDENFRVRFQDVVGGDIERMDDLLESMIEFADFSQPRMSDVALEEKLRTALQEIQSECAKRQVQIQWKANNYNREVRSDEAQLAYVLRNVLLAVLAQARVGSELEIDVEKRGSMAISYMREGGRITAITHHLDATASSSEETLLPLRILLSRQLLERNGGRMAFDQSDSEREILRLEFPIA